MLVPFLVNQTVATEFNIPAHVLDWTRVRILKEIDEIRFNATVEADMDLSQEALNSIKFFKVCMMANPKFNIDGTVSSIDPISYCFEYSSTEIIAAINELIPAIKAGIVNTQFRTFPADELQRRMIAHFNLMRDNKGPFFAKLGVANSYNDAYATLPTNVNFYTQVGADNFVGARSITVNGTPTTDFSILRNTQGTRLTNVSVKTFTRNSFQPSSSTFFLDGGASLPRLYQAAVVKAEISAAKFVNQKQGVAISTLFKAGIVSDVFFDYIVVKQKNISYQAGGVGLMHTLNLKTPTGGAYTFPVYYNTEFIPLWYKRNKVTLSNGKIFYYVSESVSYPTGNGGIYSVLHGCKNWPDLNDPYEASRSTYAIETMKLNPGAYNFPTIFPASISSGDFKIRNGYLYSDASKLYELEFYRFPELLLDKMASFIVLQASINQIEQDITDRLLISEYNSTDQKYYTYYWENGIKYAFTHPITLKPIYINDYMAELAFESVVLWGEFSKEIDAFFAPMKAANENAYQKAYEAFLRGEASLKGADALAEFERKLATGIFYSENGFNYWRAFTPVEMALIAKLKADALAAKEISDRNIAILETNRQYQLQVNTQVLQANDAKLAEAKAIASVTLKSQADADLAKMIVPTMAYLINRAETEGGLPSDALQKWVNENPYYYLREDTLKAVTDLLVTLTEIEQKVATALVTDAVTEVNFTKALMELFTILK